MNEHLEANKRLWDELALHHPKTKTYYDFDAFRAGQCSLRPLEVEEVGSVEGKRLLHLQCHFGMDTISWARRGATATGVDFSSQAIDTARQLACELELQEEVSFVESSVDELDRALPEKAAFDIVFTSYGVLTWLPSLRRWGEAIAECLAPGGFFYIAEIHPLCTTFAERTESPLLALRYPYFCADAEKPLRFESDCSYATPADVVLENKVSYEWPHSMSEIVMALIDAGLTIEFLHEFPYLVYQGLPCLERRDDGWFHLPAELPSIPLMFSLRARKEC